MYVIYAQINDEVAPIPCKAIFDSAILGSKYMELHGIDERIKDNILPNHSINIMTIKREHIQSMISFKAQSEIVREQNNDQKPKEQPKQIKKSKTKETPKKKSKKTVKKTKSKKTTKGKK